MTASCRHHPRDGSARRRGDGLRAAWIAAFLALLLCLAAPPTLGAAHAASAPPPTPVHVPAGPGVLLHPTIAVDAQGTVTVAWVQRPPTGDGAEVRLARAPAWRPDTVAATTLPDASPEGVAALRPLLVAGAELYLAWTEPTPEAMTVWRYTHAASEPAQPWGDVPSAAALAVDAAGGLQALWAAEDGLVLIAGADGADDADSLAPHTSRLTLEGAAAPTGVALALDAAGSAHVAWAQQRGMDEDGGIYYAALDSDATPTRVATAGERPRLAVGPRGTAYVCWHRSEGIHCADSRDWAQAFAVAPPLADARIALAVGPNDEAHVAWSVDGALWYANSGDWAAARRLADLDAIAVSMAIDGAGRPHLAVTVEGQGETTDLYVLTAFSPAPQLAVTAPTSGGWLADGDLVVAEANLPASDWQRVAFYLRPTACGPVHDDVLIPIGTDYDGRDGWSVPFDAARAGVDAAPHEIVVLGVDVHGGVTSAVAGPVTVLPSGSATVWVTSVGPEVVQGLGQVRVMAPGLQADAMRLEVALTATACPPPGDPSARACTIPSRTYLVASRDVATSPVRLDREWVTVTYDSRDLPDGVYRLDAVLLDADGHAYRGVAAEALVVANGGGPTVRLIEPEPGTTVRGTFRVTAAVEAGAAPVERVDFYAERQRTLLQHSQGPVRHRVEAPDIVWLGSDTDGADGWGIRVTAAPLLDGDAWVLRAEAHDARGRSTVARTERSIDIVGRERPAVRFLSPHPGTALAGVVPVSVQVTVGSRHVTGIDLYAEALGGQLLPVATLEAHTDRWEHAWDTTGLPDGDYDLVAVVRHGEGRATPVRSGAIRVRNAGADAHFLAPTDGGLLHGAARLRLRAPADTTAVTVYYRDAEGQLRLVGPATRDAPEAAEWSLVWDTAGVLDGTYDLVAVIRDAAGHLHYAEHPVEVRDASPAHVVWPTAEDTVSGRQRIAWQVTAPARVVLEWSPDGGMHWVALATDGEAQGEFTWDTTAVPDTVRARLRLTVDDGRRRHVLVSAPFTIDNRNESPSVTLLAPTAGAAHATPLFIGWHAWDPDGDPLAVTLEYRHDLGAWQPLARDLADTETYLWDTSGLAPAADYALRVTVRDPDGAQASAEVTGLRLLANRPPEVRLVTPNEHTVLRSDAVILWQAEDPDDDPLLVDLYYSDDAGQTWLPLAEGIDNTGYYMWQVSFLPMGSRYRVRVVVRDGYHVVSDDSDGMLTVVGALPPTLLLLRPAAQARVAGVVPITWESRVSAPVERTATVAIRGARETEWHPLVEDVPDDGFLLWDTSTLADGAYALRVTISDGTDEAVAMTEVTVANRRNERPEVELVAPAGGATWRGVREIVWRAWDSDGDALTATIAISTDGGATWQVVAAVDAAVGRYLWDTTALQGAHAVLARVVVSDGTVTAQAVTPAPFGVANGVSGPTARFVSPDAEGTLWRNEIIAWEAGTTSGTPPRVSLAVRREDPAAPASATAWQPIAEAAYDAGEAVLPAEWLKPGRLYRLRLTVDDGALRVGILSPRFGVVMAGSEPPTVTLEPLTGEVWSGEREIRWQTTTADERDLGATLELSRDGGVTWFDLARGRANTGAYRWDTTTVANGVYRLRLTVGDDRAESVVVSGPFEIDNPGANAPVLSLVAPRAGEVWAGTREIRWRASDSDADALTMTLAYSLDGGGTWRRFAYNVSAAEGYLWDTTTVPNAATVWLRATVSDGTFTAEDYAGPFGVWNASSPAVVLLEPHGGEHWTGEQRIAWHTAHGGGRTAKAMLQYSLDCGRTWQTIAHDLAPCGSYRWTTTTVPDGSDVLLRAYVSDGQQSGVAMTPLPVRVRRKAPPVELPSYRP